MRHKTLAMLIALLLPAAPSGACESHGFVSVSVERKMQGNWLGDYPATFRAGYRFRVADRFYSAPMVSHYSNWDLGWPFREKYEPETWSNTAGINLEARF